MAAGQLLLMTALYLVALVAIAYLTRAKARRIAGAIVGGAAAASLAVIAVKIGMSQAWWRLPKLYTFQFWMLMWLGLAVSCAPFYLITWRIDRRFGARG